MEWIKSENTPTPDTMILVSVNGKVSIGLYTCGKYCSYGSWVHPQYYCLIPTIPNE